MSDSIWISSASANADMVADLRYDVSLARNFHWKALSGHVTGATDLAEVAQWRDREPIKRVFSQGISYVNKEIHDLIHQFDTGNAVFVETRFVVYPGLDVPVPDNRFAMLPGNPRETIVIDKSSAYEPPALVLPFGKLSRFPEPGGIVATRKALAGPDIWCDPRIGSGQFFMSGRLVAALETAGFKDDFLLEELPLI